ncbi:MAG: SUMF1/EgtB/PvdO family nonheme iron enzyme [Thermodesulfobacteriota bacterium]|nr:SUMF1/EgtB/PvdO family nonheme iron enzyme [Thermodesulfobacteriota bacterium]
MKFKLLIIISAIILLQTMLGCAGNKSSCPAYSDNSRRHFTGKTSTREPLIPERTAEDFVLSHNRAQENRQAFKTMNHQDVKRSQELIRAYNQNKELARRNHDFLKKIVKNQNTGEITLFFPVDQATIPENSKEYNRLIRFTDQIAAKSDGRKIIFVLIGSASSTGEKAHNQTLSQKRANAPVPIIDHFLVNIPHSFHKIYGTGNMYSPENAAEEIDKRYRHVRIMAMYGEGYNTRSRVCPDPLMAQNNCMQGCTSRPKEFINSLGMKFIHVPAGSFIMGSPKDELKRDRSERQYQVTFTKGFYLQSTEVTQKQWLDLMGENPAHFLNCGMNCPVENIRWSDAIRFIEALNKKEKIRRYRLPSEAEWEYACRAGTSTAFCSGPMVKEGDYTTNEFLDAVGWYYRNSQYSTHKVSLKAPNAWGFYDMHGNVWEWCNDWQRPYPFNPVTDPAGASSGYAKIRRGGSWCHYPEYCRSAYRSYFDPEDSSPEIGFRLAVSESEPMITEKPPAEPQVKPEPKPEPPPEPGPKPVTKPRPDLEPVPMPGPAKIEQCMVIRDITFDLDSSKIRNAMKPVLDRAVEVLKGYKGKIDLFGNTCCKGSKAYNADLAFERAKAVKAYLVSHGIAGKRISITTFGETVPKYSNLTEAGRLLNRRVEIRVYGIPELIKEKP